VQNYFLHVFLHSLLIRFASSFDSHWKQAEATISLDMFREAFLNRRNLQTAPAEISLLFLGSALLQLIVVTITQPQILVPVIPVNFLAIAIAETEVLQ